MENIYCLCEYIFNKLEIGRFTCRAAAPPPVQKGTAWTSDHRSGHLWRWLEHDHFYGYDQDYCIDTFKWTLKRRSGRGPAPHRWSGAVGAARPPTRQTLRAVGHRLNDPCWQKNYRLDLVWDSGTETFLSILKYDIQICCVCWLTHKNIWSTKDSEIWF